jgi:hypothetical protein
MPAQVLEMKSAAHAPASVFKLVQAPLKIPAWSVALIFALTGVYGYVSGRQNPLHHYVPYVGYPLVLDTTTGKACYSSAPKPSEQGVAVNAPISNDSTASFTDTVAAPSGPAIPMCGK